MSNSAIVTICAAPIIIPVGIGIMTVKLAKWLTHKTAADKMAVARLREERRQEWRQIKTTNLHIQSYEPLVRTAEKLGYSAQHNGSDIYLLRPTGERLAISHTEQGLSLSTVGDISHVQNLVRQHALERAEAHMQSRGMQVRTSRRANGDVELLGSSAEGQINTQIHQDGSAFVDVNEAEGSHCEDMLKDLASAMGGKVSDVEKKSRCYRLPVREDVKVRI